MNAEVRPPIGALCVLAAAVLLAGCEARVSVTSKPTTNGNAWILQVDGDATNTYAKVVRVGDVISPTPSPNLPAPYDALANYAVDQLKEAYGNGILVGWTLAKMGASDEEAARIIRAAQRHDLGPLIEFQQRILNALKEDAR